MKIHNRTILLSLVLGLSLAMTVACGGDDDGDSTGTTSNGSTGTSNGTTGTSNGTTGDTSNGTTGDTSNGTTGDTSNGTTGDTSNGTTGNTSNGTTGDVDPDPTCENYCATVMANCTDGNAQYGTEGECLDYCNNAGSWDAGEKGAENGNTIACRIYHANAPASMDPVLHCPHAGPTGANVCGSWCENYCNLAINNCTDDNELYASDAACQAACTEFDDGGLPTDIQYDTVQCRIYHAGAPAAGEPDIHCPHAGVVPTDFCIGAPEDFVFKNEAPEEYTRVDRMGMAPISTAVIPSDSKNAYQDGSPADDAAGTFVNDIVGSLEFLHGALDDDLAGLELTPCTVEGDGSGSCVTAAGPLVIPDTLKIDLTGDAGFPNGRRLVDPVMDVTLAVVLLELADGTHAATDLVGVNPTANDLGVEGAFLSAFPYLHPPHAP